MIKLKYIDWVIDEKNHGNADVSSWWKKTSNCKF